MDRGAADYDFLVKLLLVGDFGTGKSSLLVRFTDDSFTSSYITTIGVDFKIRTVMCGDSIVKLQIWDTAGQERFRTITAAYYRGAMGILVVYSVSDNRSFLNIRKWMSEIDQYASDNVKRILIGNNCDVDPSERQVTYEQGAELAKEFGIQFFETSGKTNTNVDDCFMAITKEIVDHLKITSHSVAEKASMTLIPCNYLISPQ